MSKHWRPDETVVPVRFDRGKRLRSLAELAEREILGRIQRVERQLPEGAKAGLVLVAAACAGVAFGVYQAFGPRNPIAPGAEAGWNSGDDEAGR